MLAAGGKSPVTPILSPVVAPQNQTISPVVRAHSEVFQGESGTSLMVVLQYCCSSVDNKLA